MKRSFYKTFDHRLTDRKSPQATFGWRGSENAAYIIGKNSKIALKFDEITEIAKPNFKIQK